MSTQKKPKRPVCKMGVRCAEHNFFHGAEAEQLRERIESLIEHSSRGTVQVYELHRVLDEVDARDSLAYLEIQQRHDAADEAEDARP